MSGEADPRRRLDADPRRRLDAERVATRDRVNSLGAELRRLEESAAEVATDDEHDPDGSGGLAVGRAQLQALREQARQQLAEIEAAVQRLDAGRYGVCERCGRPVAAERLAARPTARVCIDCAG